MNVLLFILASWVLWLILFRNFISGAFALSGDSTIYYEHIKFYLDHIRQGTYPLWEPNRDWGVPTEFYLRRIGEFNPFYYIILLLNIIGIPYFSSYVIFLAMYYFIGLIGFFLIAKNIFRDEKMALLAYLLLMFSSLGMKLFDSYIILIFTPTVWFFYFLILFSQRQERKVFLGIIFTLMVTFITYLPFYFFTIFLSFLLVLLIFYSRDVSSFVLHSFEFIKKNRFFTGLCFVLLGVSLIPGFMLYMQGNQMDIVLPQRNSGASLGNAFSISVQKSYEGGVAILNVLSDLFSDLKGFRPGVFYIPVFGFVLLLLGVVTAADRRMLFLIIWGCSIFLISLGDATPVYQFLYHNVFFFKYFRNLQFFLWLIILPLFIFIVVGQFQKLLEYAPSTRRGLIKLLAYLSVIHLGITIFFCYQDDIIISTYWVVGLSWVSFSVYFILRYLFPQPSYRRDAIFFSSLFLLIIIQPVEVYYYLNRNMDKPSDTFSYRYNSPYDHFQIPQTAGVLSYAKQPRKIINEKWPSVWMDLRWGNFLRSNLHPEIFERYMRSKLLVYDNVEWIGEGEPDLKRIESVLWSGDNIAFISASPLDSWVQKPAVAESSQVYAVAENSREVVIQKFGVNLLRFKTDFSSQKFLVYNDSYHKKWRVYINGRKTELFRANVAFKGVWLPAGNNEVYFVYGEPWIYCLKYFLLLTFGSVFAWFLFLWINPLRHAGIKVLII